ncbi:aminoglycoside phosphotransferase family protein [Demequina gelatinilytica]|uniref:aminoglycoside phosphotransferase family protein n=1 Tax=Demequina gelatinilytica TaxID=1638980 RepID=UPI0007832621|nr:aminoglycoside phosphotransferase family protein [Demequina gelatinilytica]
MSTGDLPTGTVHVPDGLSWWAATPGGPDWLRSLPGLIAACAREWGLALDRPFEPGSVAWVAPATLPDGRRAVLKVGRPDGESDLEADALAHWAGAGAVALLAHDRERGALLIERCEPGTQLWSIEDEDQAFGIAAGVLRELWRPAPEGVPFRTVADQAERWARVLPERWERHGRPCPRRLVDHAVELATTLGRSQPEQVLCHQDAHGGNMLLDGERWVAIDPKPLVGERAFDLASSLRDRRPTLLEAADPLAVVARRLDLYVDHLGVDRERARGWGIVHALAWGLTEDGTQADLLACAELLAKA